MAHATPAATAAAAAAVTASRRTKARQCAELDLKAMGQAFALRKAELLAEVTG